MHNKNSFTYYNAYTSITYIASIILSHTRNNKRGKLYYLFLSLLSLYVQLLNEWIRTNITISYMNSLLHLKEE